MKRAAISTFFIFFFFCIFLITSPAFGQPPPTLQEGINQYNADNYEEAIEIFKMVREKEPGSSQAAFFLGLAYKQINDFQSALPPFQDAVALKPPIKEAVIELIDVLYRLDKIEEAKQWIAVAERDGLYPAKTAFLKGMCLAKEGKHTEAIQAFEKSKNIESAYSQAADVQIGLSLMSERKFAQAKERFQAALTQDPLSDLASFARRFQDIVEQRAFIERPLRVTLSMMGQYDTNMLQKPNPYTGFPDLGDEKSPAMLTSLRLDYVPTLPGSLLFNASYAFSGRFYEKNSTTHNMLANTVSVAPGYNFGRFAVNLIANYTHALRQNPSYKNYSELYNIGPMVRFLLNKNSLLEIYGGYANKNYFTKSLTPEEDQSSIGFDSYISWMWLFENGGILNLKYGFNDENANGRNWNNSGHRFTLNLLFPIWKNLRAQLGGEAYFQNYKNEHTVFNKKRSDTTYTGIAGLILDINRNLSLTAQYNYIRSDSNIFLYDYSRSIYSAGIELKF